MSIYCTSLAIGDEHLPRCSRMKKIGRKFYSYDESKPCTCGESPILYLGSHVLPTILDKRGGSLHLAFIPGHITRGGRDDKPEGGNPYPWLRVSMFGAKNDSLILTRKQAEKLLDALNKWLKWTGKSERQASTE